MKKQTSKATESPKNMNTISHCNIELNVVATEAAQALAEAMRSQAEANCMLAEAMSAFAQTLKPKDICAIKMTSDGVNISNSALKA